MEFEESLFCFSALLQNVAYSYKDLRRCLEEAFNELQQKKSTTPTSTTTTTQTYKPFNKLAIPPQSQLFTPHPNLFNQH